MRIIVLMLAWLMSYACMAQVYFPFKKNNRYGYIDTLGNWIIQPVFDHATFFNGNKALANKGDSVFTVSLNGEIRQVAQIKSFISFGQSIALLNKDGKWALSDTSLIAGTQYMFNRVDTCGGFIKAMDAENLWSLYDKAFKRRINGRFDMIGALKDSLFLCRNGDQNFIYKLIGDTLKLLRSGNFICKFNNPGFEIFSRKLKLITYLNANGDSIYSCTNCLIINKCENLKVIQDKNLFTLIDFNTGEKLATSGIDTGIMLYNRFYWVAADSLYCRPGYSPVKVNEQIDGFLNVSEKCNIFFKNNLWGVMSIEGNVLIRPNYEWIVLLDNDVLRIYDEHSFLYHIGSNKRFKSINLNSEVGFVGSSIMVTYNDTTELLKYDQNYDLIDSNNYYKVKFMKAGMKTSAFDNSTVGNNSTSNRYFYHRSKYGLLSLNRDTLVKAIFLSVSRINDSLDMVSLLNSNMVTIMSLGNVRMSCNKRYGILNNRTGKFILNPDYFYISITDFKDTNYNVFRVLTRSKKFGLINKTSMEINKNTLSDYIATPHYGYFRLFNGLRLHLKTARKNIYLKNNGFDFGAIIDFNYFSSAFVNEQGKVMGYAKSVNLVNRKGEMILSESQAKKNLFVESGFNGTFIFNSNFDSTGVYDSTGNVIVKPSYKSIRRLKQDNRFFLLYTYDNKFGYLNKAGEEISIAKYKKAFNFNDGFAWCQYKDSMMLLDSIGNEYDFGVKYSQVIDVSEGYTAYRKKKGWVLIDLNGEIVSDDYYKKIHPFINGTAVAQSKGGWGIIDVNGNWLLSPNFETFEAENESSVVFKNNNKRHFFSRDGQPYGKQKVKGVLKPLSEDLFMETIGSQSKIYLKNGDLYKKRKFSDGLIERNDTIFSISKRRVQVYYQTKKAMNLNHTGGYRSVNRGNFELNRTKSMRIAGSELFVIPESFKYIYPNVFKNCSPFFRLYYPKNTTYSVVNKNMVDCYRLNAFILKYNFGGENGLNLYSLADSLGNLHNEILFTNIKYVGDDLFAASFKNEYNVLVTGLMNRFGIWVVQPKFADIDGFNEGFTSYSVSNQFYFADSTGQLVTPFLLDEIKDSNGYLLLNSDTEMAWWHPKKGWLTKFED